VVLPSDAAAWLRERPELGDYLIEHAQVAWESRWVTVFELDASCERQASARWRETRRVEVEMALPSAGDTAAFLDLPTHRALLPAHAVAVAGWVLDRGSAAEAIEFEHEGELVWRAPVSLDRPDVAEAFAPAPERCGFQTTFNASELAAGATVDLFAVFASGARVGLSKLRFLMPTDDRARGERALRVDGAGDGAGS
jgi:hypothetical protein